MTTEPNQGVQLVSAEVMLSLIRDSVSMTQTTVEQTRNIAESNRETFQVLRDILVKVERSQATMEGLGDDVQAATLASQQAAQAAMQIIQTYINQNNNLQEDLRNLSTRIDSITFKCPIKDPKAYSWVKWVFITLSFTIVLLLSKVLNVDIFVYLGKFVSILPWK